MSTPPRGDATTSREVARVLRHVERDVVRISARIILFGGVPLIAVFVLSGEIFSASPLFWIEAALFTVAGIGGVSDRVPHYVQSLMLVVAMVGTSAIAMVSFGPTMGTGLFCVTALLGAAFFFGRGGALVTCAVLGVAYWGTFVAATRGWATPRFTPDPVSWWRIGVSTTLAIGASTYLFLRARGVMRGSVVALVAAREAEAAAHAEREEIAQRAAAAHRLESLGRLAGGVAHDFNNALAVIQTNAALLRDAQPERRDALLDSIERGAQRAAGTARQLLAFARRNVEEVGSCRADAVLPSLVDNVRGLLPENVTVEVDAASCPPVALSSHALEQVVLNLLLNARDALPKGGHVRVACRPDGDAHVLVEVGDDGVGMPREVLERAFEPFFTTKGEHGSGLGLAMVWGAITRAGGTVAIESEVGKGTTFLMRVPVGAAPVARVASRPDAPMPAEPGRILVIEDTEEVRRAIVRLLEHAGFPVTSVHTIGDALDEIDRGDYALLLTDGVLPDGPVSTAIEAFRRRTENGPVIICSGYTEEDLAIQGVARRDYDFVAKPFAPKELVAAVRRAIGGAPDA